MHSNQQDLRYAAAQQFLEALDELDQCSRPVAADKTVTSSPQSSRSSAQAAPLPSLKAWEDAVLDIEQFMQSR